MARLRVELIDVYCGDTEDVHGEDEFYVVGAVTDGSNTRGVLTSPLGINDGQTRAFASGQSVIFDADVPPDRTLRIALEAYDEDSGKDWAKYGQTVTAISGAVGSALVKSGNPYAVAAGTILPVAVKAFGGIMSMDKDDRLGATTMDVPVASLLTTQEWDWTFKRKDWSGYSSWDYRVRIRASYDGGRASWHGWYSLGGQIRDEPGVVIAGDTVDVYARGINDVLHQQYWIPSRGAWSGWIPHDGGILGSGPCVVSSGPDHRDVYARGADGGVWHKWWNGAKWSGWEDLGGEIQGSPGVVIAGGKTHIYARGMDDALWEKYRDGSSWSEWRRHDDGGILTSGPCVVSSNPNHRDVYARGADGGAWRKWWDGAKWSRWEGLGGELQGRPGAVLAGGGIDIYARGMDNALWQKYWTGSGWSDWLRHDDGGVLGSAPTVVSGGPNHRDVYAAGSDSALYQKWWG